LPALQEPALHAARVLPGGFGLDISFLEIEPEGLGDALSDFLGTDDFGRLQEFLPIGPLGDLFSGELSADREDRDQDKKKNCGINDRVPHGRSPSRAIFSLSVGMALIIITCLVKINKKKN
jgi:hypothetical protein